MLGMYAESAGTRLVTPGQSVRVTLLTAYLWRGISL